MKKNRQERCRDGSIHPLTGVIFPDIKGPAIGPAFPAGIFAAGTTVDHCIRIKN
jgi:hypothetical protein